MLQTLVLLFSIKKKKSKMRFKIWVFGPPISHIVVILVPIHIVYPKLVTFVSKIGNIWSSKVIIFCILSLDSKFGQKGTTFRPKNDNFLSKNSGFGSKLQKNVKSGGSKSGF